MALASVSSLAGTQHRVIFGNCTDMHEVRAESIQLTVTSPPYYNAPFDYPGMYKSYGEFLGMISKVADELYRVTAPGRVACFVVDDMLVEGEKLPIVADVTTLMRQAGFRYRDRILWVKPKGYTRISRRSGVLIQHPYPMYFYPDNIQESVLIFQKGRFDYSAIKSLDSDAVEKSKIDSRYFNENEWNLTVWQITNVLPSNNPLEKGIAAFPDELASRLVKLFSFYGETVLDPFLGSGTTSRVSAELGRNSVGYELLSGLRPRILAKIRQDKGTRVSFEKRDDCVAERRLEEVKPISRRAENGHSLR